LPYGTTACKWDVIIPFDKLWEQYKRIVKPNAAIVLTASQPFTSQLVMSNLEWFKYEWIWDKKISANYLAAKKMPLLIHENIIVFSNGGANNGAKNPMTYNPVMVDREKVRVGILNSKPESQQNPKYHHLKGREKLEVVWDKKYPVSIVEKTNAIRIGKTHPTQKPVALFEYLIKTYTNEGDLVLDNCAGSGTTAVAAINTNRNYICIEKEKEYFDIACDRISQPREYSESELETMELKQPEFEQLSLFENI
jgi:site-specific DNA-methyltransferase (adenine-specific)